ncbi:MAG: polysaccharide pyruvyl transferase family protein [Cyanobacteria bacterium J06623_5]
MQKTTVQNIHQSLQLSLSAIGPIAECILLDYPNYYNIGDRLIWLGTLFYLASIDARISYAASITDCSDEAIARHPHYPILLQGGGNLGDLWPQFQSFRERIISQYPHQPIVILPQSIHFEDSHNLRRAARVFNSHPNLTLFVRDTKSDQIARHHFHQCRVFKAPDMALQMALLPGLEHRPIGSSILFLGRQDKENNAAFSPENLGLESLCDRLLVEDWVSFSWMNKLPPNWPYVPGLVRLIREGWQRGLSHPVAWVQRQQWMHLHPGATILGERYRSAIYKSSWSMMHSGLHQLAQHRLVVTNRLHVHILCALMDIPHVVLPGSYHKISSFYEAWSQGLENCRLVSDPREVKSAAADLLEQQENLPKEKVRGPLKGSAFKIAFNEHNQGKSGLEESGLAESGLERVGRG